jgi:uncharacterized protein (DUF2062 family)
MKVRFKDWRIIRLILGLFQQGMSAEKIALCITLGFLIGTFPVLGSTTLLCGLAALAFRLNLPLIQLVNYFVYPLQLILLLPLWHMGQVVLGQKPLDISMAQLAQMIHQNLWLTMEQLWWVTVAGIGAWVLAAVPLGFLIYGSLFFLLRRFLQRKLQNA